MKKNLFAFTMIAITASFAKAFQLKCYGVDLNKGSVATLTFIQGQYTITGTQVEDGKLLGNIKCSGRFDVSYKPRTKDPKQDRYSSAGCSFTQAMISKTLPTTGQGYVNLSEVCGPDGDMCGLSYLCK